MKKRLEQGSLIVLVLVTVQLVIPSAGAARATWWSLVPPVLAISLALAFKDVIVSLFLGVWLGASMLAGGNVALGFLRVVDTHMRGALVDSDHVSIILFSLLLGGMVGVMSRAGGTHGVVRLLEPLATTPRRAQLATWVMGVLIFFDDYSNTLIVGNAMRPVTDRHGVSREKLSYLVDSTAAPVACIALVSTWIGYQVSLLSDALKAGGSPLNPFSIFLASIPFAFYPVLALATNFTAAVTGRDFGPMLNAERRARLGEVSSPTAQPLADYESSGLAPEDDTPRRWLNAALPVVTVVLVTLVGLLVTGWQALAKEGVAHPGLSRVVGASDPFTVLLWASLLGITLAIGLAVAQNLLSMREALEAAVRGFKSMLMAMVVLTLAWSLGGICSGLETAHFLVKAVGPHLAVTLIPAAVFVVAALVSFATGTSWGTMAIMTPLAVPLVLSSAAVHLHHHLVAETVAAILGGSVFGDHCSPISDTTIMSSMASSCDHVDHVRTQLPYALLGALAALLLGYLPEALYDVPSWVSMPVGVAAIFAWFYLVGRPVDDEGLLAGTGGG
ncbi:MAG: Na+/H+ antiporter NhaC family protein [Acidobacteria bacterium]|nr:Na+/H+ antiporter NhaC family protein [Acidobacteriota bacterium]